MASGARAMAEQAVRDLAHARADEAGGFFEWACVSAQQSAEKALKAVLLHAGAEPERTHTLPKLMEALVAACVVPPSAAVAWEPALARLTRDFLIGRYPQGDGDTPPARLFFAEDAARAIGTAVDVMALSRSLAPDVFA